MDSSKLSFSERVVASYSELTSIAADLNAVSDAFGKAVSDIDEGLRKLNLGVTAWVGVQEYGGSHDQDLTYTKEELGYAKINGKWGIALRVRSGDDRHPEFDESVEDWLFNEAARTLRLKAVKKIPELLNKLNEEAAKVTKELQAELTKVQAVSAAVQLAARDSKVTGSLALGTRTGAKRINSAPSGFTPPPPLNTPAGFTPPPTLPKSEVKP